MILNNIFQTVEKKKKFKDSVDEEFASVFTRQTAKLVEIVKAREEK